MADPANGTGVVAQWVDTAQNAVNKLGIHTIIILFVMGLYTGWIPSALTHAHEQVLQLLWQNQVILTTMFSFKNAECLNKADADSKGDDLLFSRGQQRCNDANKQLERYLVFISQQKKKMGEP